MFENPGKAVQRIALFCFFACILIAVFLFIVGGLRILTQVNSSTSFKEVLSYTAEDYAYGLLYESDQYVNGYEGKMQCKTAIYIALASLSTIPMYAFGRLVEDVGTIKNELYQLKK